MLKKIELYLSRPAVDPLVLYGLSGSGKTSVLAKAASLVRSWLNSQLPIVIVRFLGTLITSVLDITMAHDGNVVPVWLTGSHVSNVRFPLPEFTGRVDRMTGRQLGCIF